MEKSNDKKRIPTDPETAPKKKGDSITDSRAKGTASRGSEMTNARGHHQYITNNSAQQTYKKK